MNVPALAEALRALAAALEAEPDLDSPPKRRPRRLSPDDKKALAELGLTVKDPKQ